MNFFVKKISFEEAARQKGPLRNWKKVCLLALLAAMVTGLATLILTYRLLLNPTLFQPDFGNDYNKRTINLESQLQKDTRVWEILEKSSRAMGGPDRFKGLEDMVQKGRIQIEVGGTKLIGERILWTTFKPYRFKLKQKFLDQETLILFEGQNGWQIQNGKPIPLPPAMVEGIKSEMERSQLLMNYKDSGYSGRYLGSGQIWDTYEVEKVILTGSRGNQMTVFFDKKNYYLRGYEFKDLLAEAPTEIRLENYTNIGEYAVPLQISAFQNHQQKEVIIIDQIDINSGLSANIFQLNANE
jgi:hypothetical protein